MNAQMTSAEIYYTQALWYAWGQIDAGVGSGELTLQDGWDYAETVRDARIAFDNQETSSFPSLISSWRAYAAGKGVSL